MTWLCSWYTLLRFRTSQLQYGIWHLGFWAQNEKCSVMEDRLKHQLGCLELYVHWVRNRRLGSAQGGWELLSTVFNVRDTVWNKIWSLPLESFQSGGWQMRRWWQDGVSALIGLVLLGKSCCRHLTPANSVSPSMMRHEDDGYSKGKDVKAYPRDSGYDSLSNRLSILDRLLHTHPIWLQLNLSEEEAAKVLQSQPPGVSLRTTGKQVKVGRPIASLKTKTWSSRKFFLVHKEHGPRVYLGGNAGKFWKVWRPLQGKEPFTICLCLYLLGCHGRFGTQQDNRASG